MVRLHILLPDLAAKGHRLTKIRESSGLPHKARAAALVSPSMRPLGQKDGVRGLRGHPQMVRHDTTYKVMRDGLWEAVKGLAFREPVQSFL